MSHPVFSHRVFSMRVVRGVPLVILPLLAGCMPPAERPRPVPAAGPAMGAQRVIQAEPGGTYMLPDGTRVLRDGAGSFVLPNGEYVRRAPSGDLVLPNGNICRPSGPNYVCP